ncbi:MAG: MBL fold metallo-hydrolase, partial [Planctomycetota bacterium]
MPLSEASVILLGTGTSSGVPVLGCDCSVCTSTDPRDQRLRTSAALRFQDPDGHFREMLIDCGPDLRHQALRAGLRRCDGIFVTHHHVDHIYGLDEVRRFNALMKEPIDLFAEERTLDAIHRVYRHIFDAAKNLNPSFVAHVRTHRVTTDGSVSRMGIRATPIRLLHGKMPILGWRFDAV